MGNSLPPKVTRLDTPKILFIPEDDEGIVVTELVEIYPEVYNVPNTLINISKNELTKLPYSDKFLVTRTKDTYGGSPDPLSTLRIIKKRNRQEEEKIPNEYEPPFVMGAGTYGTVIGNKASMIATKKSTRYDDDDKVTECTKYTKISPDMVKEIAIYRLFSQLPCLPELYNFNIEDKVELNFELGNTTLSKYMETLPKESPEKRSIMLRLASCLSSIAVQGIINCDLKPANIIISQTGKVQIIDWGIAEIDYGKYQFREKNTNIQTSGYRAPEIQCKSKLPYDYKVDIFSLGIIFLQLVEKRDYYFRDLYNLSEENTLELLVKGESICSEIEEKIAPIVDNIELRKLISKMLEPNPGIRIDYNKILSSKFFLRRTMMDIPKSKKLINQMPRIKNINEIFTNVFKSDGRVIRKNMCNWLFDACKKNKLYPETFCLSLQLVDLYVFETKEYDNDDLIYLMNACVSIACNLFETRIMDYVSLDRNDRDEFQKCVELEKEVIKVLNGNVLIPTMYSYWSRKKRNVPLREIKFFIDMYLEDDVYDKIFS